MKQKVSDMNLFGCLLCGKQLNNMVDYIQHIDDDHPRVAKKIKERWKQEGLI